MTNVCFTYYRHSKIEKRKSNNKILPVIKTINMHVRNFYFYLSTNRLLLEYFIHVKNIVTFLYHAWKNFYSEFILYCKCHDIIYIAAKNNV